MKSITLRLPVSKTTPERYWVPMIAMYSGMRLQEICQLYRNDLRKVDGIWCFDINDDTPDKQLKTASSKRLVPVHPELIRLGLLNYHSQVNHERLWPNLSYIELHGYTNSIGKWFQRFNREYVTDDPQKTFHSFRHTFIDTLKQLQVQGAIISEIAGHAVDSITMGRYGKRFNPEVLLEAVSMVRY